MQLYLLLNESCNLNCSFCIRGKSKDRTFIELEKLKKVLSENDFSKYHLLLTGGEPSLHKNLAEIIDVCHSRFKGISVNTNGINLDWIDKCKYTDIHIQISLDGTKDMHNEMRGNGKIDLYGKIMNNIQKLNNRKISYNISTTVNKKNIENIRELVNEINNFENIKYWKVSPQLPFGCGNIEDVLDIEQWNNLVNYLIKRAKILLKISKLFDFNLFDKYFGTHNVVKSMKSNCGGINCKIYVYPDFTVYPCTCLKDFPLGNLLSNKLDDIMKNEICNQFRNYKVKEDSICSTCKYLSICNGGCIGMSYNFFGELGRGDIRCPYIMK